MEWTGLQALPLPGGAEGAFAAVIDQKLVVAGGVNGPASADESGAWTAMADVWVLESPDGSWRKTTPLPQPTAFGASASAGTFAVFAGGSAGAGAEGRDSAYRVVFEGDELRFQPLPPLPGARSLASAAMLDGAVYLACGRGTDGEPTSDMLVLDLNAVRPAWEIASPLPATPRVSVGLTAREGALFLLGGAAPAPASNDERARPLADSYKFVPGAGWTRVADRPAPASGQTVPLGPTHIASVGNSSDGTGRPLRAMAYHVLTDTWVSQGELPAGAERMIAVDWGGTLVAAGKPAEPGTPATPVFAAHLVAEPSGFSTLDYTALACYFAALVMMGIYFARQGSSTEDFFLGGRSMPWWATGLSIYGTQLSSISFMAVPAKVYATDWIYILVQLSIILLAFPVVYLYLPHFRRVKMTSAYEYLESRFNLPVRIYASLSFVLYQLGRMAIVMFLPAIALSTVTGISVYSCILVMGVLATLYTVMGGIKAVIWTDVTQVFVLYGGAVLSLVILLGSMDGGLSGLLSAGQEYDKFHIVTWSWDWTTTAVWVVLVGNLFMNLVPYTSDQAVVQRYFTTKDEKAAARSIWTNAVLLIPSTLTLFLLGTGLWAFYRANPELLDPALPTDSIFPLFIAQQLPSGIAGLLIAAVFAASMSTLDSSLNSVSAALVTDFYARFRPASSDRRRLALARWLTAGLGVLATATSIALATFNIGSLWDAFQGMMGLLGGGLAGLFALGMFFRRANGAGAITGAVSSVVVLYWVQQHTDLHFFLYGAVGILSCVGIGLLASQVLGVQDSGSRA